MPRYNTITVISRKDEEILRLNQRVIEDSPDLISIVGDDFKFFYVNPSYASVHGLGQEDFVGRHIRDFVGREAFESIIKPNMERCSRGEDVRYEEWFNFPETGVRFMDVRYLPLKNGGAEVSRIVVILRDITYMKKAEASRINEEKLKTIIEMAGTYNHEINNPLCALSGFLELLKINVTDQKNLTYITKALGEIGRITEVTKKLAEATSVSLVDYPGGGKIVSVEHES